MTDDSAQGFFGQQGLSNDTSQVTRHDFATHQHRGRVRTSMIVKVVKVIPDKDDPISNGPVVHVMPLVNQIDGQGNATDHGTIYNIPVVRHQGGDMVFINDPVVNDIGHMSIHDRDISSVKASSKQANPASFRRHDPADGVYHFALLNKTKVKRYVMPNDDGGIDLVDMTNGNKISTGSKGINLNGVIIDTKGNLIAPGKVMSGAGTDDEVTLGTHTHDDVQPGAGHTGKPDAGT